jgi:tRNA A-37 threonylcarbamoyl transferase component Bud32
MGEVYRADDLKLAQQVALKFLPSDVDHDPARLTQLHTEVRMARQVSHPNVCRVYDIDELDGHTFIAMEYVDGEDLASLLRRVGRFPEDRASEIARQVCAGLAAAHQRDVVHRDLKPANVMLDGTGRVRITDFGLAGAAGEAIRAGTPAYMAPEQLAGQEVTARSDIYSLGLLLYEVFTGQRALEGKNLAEIIRKREQSGIVPPTEVVKTLDPKIEAAIMRCLRPDPAARPASALAVAAALPGGDPLAAALAAGETPSPQMIAAAGDTAAMNLRYALPLVIAILVGLIAFGAIGRTRLLYDYVPMQRSLDSLEDRARELATTFGYPERPVDSARGLRVNFSYVSWISRTDKSPTRWESLRGKDAPVMLFWYRASPAALVPKAPDWAPSLDDPPPIVPGMLTITLDDRGRLHQLQAEPPRQPEDRAATPGAAWPPLFAAAGLSLADFSTVTPQWIPLSFTDEHAAWEGPFRGDTKTRIRVEAGAYQGRPVFFQIVGPWAPPSTPSGQPASTGFAITRGVLNFILLLVLIATVALARSNLKSGRGDRRGAARTALFALILWSLAWALSGRHYAAFENEFGQFFAVLGAALLNAGIIWLLYVALEPYVRRFTPHLLVSWSRVMAGQLRDPQVGRDLLIGVASGLAVALLNAAFAFLPLLTGAPPPTPRSTNLLFLMDAHIALGTLIRGIPNAVINALFMSITYVLGRAISGRGWVGAICAGALFAVFVLGESTDRLWVILLFAVLFVSALVATVVYAGILSLAIAFLVQQTLNVSPVTLDWSQPHASGALWTILLILGVTAFGFYAARAGQPLFGRLVQTD